MPIFRPRALALTWGFMALWAPGSANAQTIPSPYSFIDRSQDAGVFFGVVQDHRGELGIGPGGGPMFGGRYSIDLGGPIAAEITGYAISSDREVFGVQPGTGLVPRGTQDVLLIAVDGRFRFTLTGARSWHGVAPFILAGGGIVGSVESATTLEDDIPATHRVAFGPGFVAVTGAGTRWIPADRLTFRAEATMHLWRVSAPAGFVEVLDDIGRYPEKDWVSVGGVVFGVSYRF